MKYDLVTAHSEGSLKERVNTMLECGWKLYGNPTLTTVQGPRGFTEYAQAVIKED